MTYHMQRVEPISKPPPVHQRSRIEHHEQRVQRAKERLRLGLRGEQRVARFSRRPIAEPLVGDRRLHAAEVLASGVVEGIAQEGEREDEQSSSAEADHHPASSSLRSKAQPKEVVSKRRG